MRGLQINFKSEVKTYTLSSRNVKMSGGTGKAKIYKSVCV